MRFIILVALVGIVAARCPFNSKRCFNQLIQQNQNQFGQQYENEGEIDDESEFDQTQQQQQDGYRCQLLGQCDQDQDNQDENDGECEQGDYNCQTSQQQQNGQQCRPNYQHLQHLEQPNSRLAAKLYTQAKQENDDTNTVVSPAAVQLTLAALQHGARGNTKAQIKRVQCPQLSQQQCQQAQAALIRSLKASNNVQQTQRPGGPGGRQNAKINVPVAIVVNQQTQTQRQFVQIVQQCLGAQVKQCSFARHPQQCAQQINQLLSAKTNQKLQTVVTRQRGVTQNTRLIAVSGLQLNAKWNQQFSQQQTSAQGRFYPLGSQQPKVCQVVKSRGQFNYHEDEQVQVLGIPTQQQELTFYAIVPKRRNGLNQVERQRIQNGQQLRQLLDSCDQQTQYLRVQLPQFQAQYGLDAKKTLQQQGVQDAFDSDAANFGGITGVSSQQGQKLHLNKLIQQATIKINAQGISAASTGSQNSQYTQDQQENQQQSQNDDFENDDHQTQYGQNNQVNVNHAFAFVIKHNPSNQIIAIGRIVDPTQTPQGQQQTQNQNQNQFENEDQE